MGVKSVDANRPTAVPWQVRRALDYMRANLREKIALETLAAACGISQRTLLEQFKRFVGASPIAHLQRMRLAEARTELQQCDQGISISDVALRCGITHIGRFAAGYRKTFGELPSATQRRARVKPVNGAPATYEDARGAIRAPFVLRQRPSLLILPLRTETLPERRVAQELMEQVAATLSRASVATVTFADPTVSVSRKLGWSPKGNAVAQYCLNGRLVQRDDRVRITLWLMDGEGRHVWGDSYEGLTESSFHLLRRVADSVLLGVIPGITGAEIERIRCKDPQILGAREMLMQALRMLLKADAESWREMLAVASHAMELDPDDALPLALGAYCQARLYDTVTTARPREMRDTALQLFSRANALDNGDPFAIATRAGVATLLGRGADAEALVERALAMDPTSAWIHERAGVYFLYQAKPDRAMAHFGRAMQLHGPFMPRENCLFGIAKAHQCAGRSEQALHWIRRALAENPRAEIVHRFLVVYEAKLSHHAEARRQAAELCRMHPEARVSRLVEVHPHGCFEDLLRAGVPL